MPIDFTQKLEKARDIYRRQFIRLVIAQESAIDDQLEALNDELESLVVQGSEIRDQDEINRKLPSLFEVYSALYLASIISFNNKSASVKEEAYRAEISDEYNSAEFNRLATIEGNKFLSYIKNTLPYRTYPVIDGVSIGARIKTIEKGSVKTVRNIISVGIENGEGSKQIASEIQNYIVKDGRKKWVSPWSYYREKHGYKIKKVPRGIPAGSLEYNAKRIARTEINNTWRQGTLILNKDKPWVKGFSWNLSVSHPVKDICDEWAEGSPYQYDDIRSFGHPHCMCYIETVLKDKKEIK